MIETLNEQPVLDQIALGYSPMIDRNRSVMATRLTVFPLRPDAKVSAQDLLRVVGMVWPPATKSVSLNVLSESLVHDLLQSEPSNNVMIEVPSFIACEHDQASALMQLKSKGYTLLIKGRPAQELPRSLLQCFTHSIIDAGEDRRGDLAAPEGVARAVTHVQSGIRTIAEVDSAFKRGAHAVLGWPLDDAITMSSSGKQAEAGADLHTIVELINRVDREEEVDRLEPLLKNDPTLAYKLMRFINSPAFGLSVEISSFRHAIMILGYKRLKRWLALLLASASKDQNMKPVMFAAVRRGLLMEELGRSAGDEQMRNELFICGVFSLLDRMMKQPFSVLLKSIPVPERVYETLVENRGPYQSYVDIVSAVENESLFDIRAAAESAFTTISEVNAAVLRALAAASQLE